jgi:3-hydroxyacyl-CoA dehydrogenase
MPLDVQRVCVIGAGTMGGGIAAHLANLGFKVALIDLHRDSAINGLARANSAKPPHFTTGQVHLSVETSGLQDGYPLISKADWICEAIVEKLEAKRALYGEIAGLMKPGAILTTNTSGLEISLLAADLAPHLRRSFVGTHFFNPPRYLKLLELIPTTETDPGVLADISDFLEDKVGRRVIPAKDTPGFIANRFGMWSMFHAIHCAERLGLSIEQVDAITGPFLGRPKSGSFRLNDIVGLDVMWDIAQNLVARCDDDPHLKYLGLPSSMAFLLEKGWIGDKVRQGYYRREGDQFLSLDFKTHAYRERQEQTFASLDELGTLPLPQRIRTAVELRDEVGEFLRLHLIPTLQYASYLKEQVSYTVEDFDRVMKWGFGWQLGPFELIDAIGGEKLAIAGGPFYYEGQQRSFEGTFIPRKAEPQFQPITEYPILDQRATYRLRDLGDGVTALSMTGKMGIISPAFVHEATELLEGGFDRFVLTSEARSFSAGFDLSFFLNAIFDEDWIGIDHALRQLQYLGELIESRSSVAGIFGHCLGAGLELAGSCSVILAQLETQIGLPEAKVGLLPGGRGATLMRLNNQANAKRLAEASMTLTLGEVGTNAEHARHLGYLRASDVTCFHPDRVLWDAKQAALTAIPRVREHWAPVAGPVVGMIDREQEQLRQQGKLSNHDEVIGDKIKSVLAKTHFYEESLDREREGFIELCGKALTVARIKHMLETGKPLRN